MSNLDFSCLKNKVDCVIDEMKSGYLDKSNLSFEYFVNTENYTDVNGCLYGNVTAYFINLIDAFNLFVKERSRRKPFSIEDVVMGIAIKYNGSLVNFVRVDF